MSEQLDNLVKAIDNLEDALASYFVDKDIPDSIRITVDGVEHALIEAGLSPLQPTPRRLR